MKNQIAIATNAPMTTTTVTTCATPSGGGRGLRDGRVDELARRLDDGRAETERFEEPRRERQKLPVLKTIELDGAIELHLV